MAGEPIFLWACAPRSGSTWLQRVITANGALIWGEGSVLGLQATGLPGSLWTPNEPPELEPDWDLRRFRKQRHEMWMAVLKPSEQVRDLALKAYCLTAFAGPARELGYDRWGVKETLWTPVDAECVRRLWPRARRVFLHRDPVRAFRSRFSESYSPPEGKTREVDQREWCADYVARTRYALTQHDLLVEYERLVGEPEYLRALLAELGLPTYCLEVSRISASVYQPPSEAELDLMGQYAELFGELRAAVSTRAWERR